jgi:hypothetical protein
MKNLDLTAIKFQEEQQTNVQTTQDNSHYINSQNTFANNTNNTSKQYFSVMQNIHPSKEVNFNADTMHPKSGYQPDKLINLVTTNDNHTESGHFQENYREQIE